MAVDLDRPYSAVAFKASHNSYERDELPVSTQFADLGDSSWQGRCRGIELDLNASGRNWLWSVNHVGGYGGQIHGSCAPSTGPAANASQYSILGFTFEPCTAVWQPALQQEPRLRSCV